MAWLFSKKDKKKENLEKVVEPNLYDMAMEEIEKEKGEKIDNEPVNQENIIVNLDITPFQENQGISFFDPNYNSKIKNSLMKSGFKKSCNQIEDLEYRYIGHDELGKTDSDPKGEVSLQTAKLFDKIFMNKVYNKSLEGKLNNLNGSVEGYKEFYKKYMKENKSEVAYENRKEVLKSLEKLSQWVSGEEVETINKEVCNINKYLLEDIKEETAMNNAVILNKRMNNLIRKYDNEFSKESNYNKFLGCVNVIDGILDSASQVNLNPTGELKLRLHNFLTKKYAEVQEDDNLDNIIKQKATQDYSKIFERFHGISYEEAIKQIVNTQNP